MKFDVFIFNKTALHSAVESENCKILKLLLVRRDVDVNAKLIKTKIIFLI